LLCSCISLLHYYFTLLGYDNRYLHGCNVLYDLVKPWGNTNSIVVADS
jgi:hypothetical protein